MIQLKWDGDCLHGTAIGVSIKNLVGLVIKMIPSLYCKLSSPMESEHSPTFQACYHQRGYDG
jgi:hypothetical protein